MKRSEVPATSAVNGLTSNAWTYIIHFLHTSENKCEIKVVGEMTQQLLNSIHEEQNTSFSITIGLLSPPS